MKSIKKIITTVFIMTLALFVIGSFNVEAKSKTKTKKYLKVYDLDTDKVVHYIKGESDCDDISDVYLKTNYKIKKISWSSNKDEVAECLYGTKDIVIKYFNKGTAVITLTVKDNKNKKHRYKLFASSYEPYDTTQSRVVKKKTIIRKGATIKKYGVSSKIKKTKSQMAAKIYGECGNYYYAKVGKTKGFILKNSIVPHTDITATPINGKIKLNVKNVGNGATIYRTTNEKETNINKCTKISVKKAEYIDSNVKPGVRYFYKYKYNNKVYTGATTYTNVINGKENVKYFKSLNYPNLYIQGQDDKAFNDNWKNYIRFYLTNKGSTIEAHVNIKYFLDRVEFSRTKFQQGMDYDYYYHNENSLELESFMDVFMQGLKNAYNIFVPGSKNDFNNHSFNFVIKIHEYDCMDYYIDNDTGDDGSNDGIILNPTDQPTNTDTENKEKEKPLTYNINLGNNNGGWLKEGKDEYLWSFATINPRELYIASSRALEYNKSLYGNTIPSQYKTSEEEYKNTCAHEFGHLLGLSDAYCDTKGNDRMCENEETCRIEYVEGKKYYNSLFKECSGKATPNDIEMILYANRLGNDIEGQSYKTTKNDTISKVIHNRSDYVK